ncbi:hypothetical protein [Nocardia cyriacigeorgica]|uniref:hypothetical protein n=1 Tax=Nocardia cyriacigeorgica TaxID=135487 RepID=UPI00273FD3C1|nr:hypothetical protein [Nocardia cyriacigeorgica]
MDSAAMTPGRNGRADGSDTEGQYPSGARSGSEAGIGAATAADDSGLIERQADRGEPVIYIVDEMVAPPGRGRAFLDLYLREYAPGARERGLELDRVLVSPPVWLAEQSNTITVSWTVRGAQQWWRQRLGASRDPQVAQWWQAADELLVSRRRTTACGCDDVEVLADV